MNHTIVIQLTHNPIVKPVTENNEILFAVRVFYFLTLWSRAKAAVVRAPGLRLFTFKHVYLYNRSEVLFKGQICIYTKMYNI